MKKVSFELTMPNVGSWNGKWTGADKKYYVIKRLDNETTEKLMQNQEKRNFYYRWSDGWGANICAEIVDAKEAKKREKVSSGFCGYEWMISSILEHDKIIND